MHAVRASISVVSTTNDPSTDVDDICSIPNPNSLHPKTAVIWRQNHITFTALILLIGDLLDISRSQRLFRAGYFHFELVTLCPTWMLLALELISSMDAGLFVKIKDTISFKFKLGIRGTWCWCSVSIFTFIFGNTIRGIETSCLMWVKSIESTHVWYTLSQHKSGPNWVGFNKSRISKKLNWTSSGLKQVENMHRMIGTLPTDHPVALCTA